MPNGYLKLPTWYFCGMNSLMGVVGRILTRWVLLGGVGESGQLFGAWQSVTFTPAAMKLPS